MSISNGVASIVVDLLANLPPANRRRIGDIAHLANGDGYTVQSVGGVRTWVPDAGTSGTGQLRFFASPDVSPDTATHFGTLGAAMSAANAVPSAGNLINVIVEVWPGTPPGVLPTMTRGVQIIGMTVGPQTVQIAGSFSFTGGSKRIGFENLRIVPTAVSGIGVAGDGNSVYLRNVQVETITAGVQGVSFSGTGNELVVDDVKLTTVGTQALVISGSSVNLIGLIASMSTSTSANPVVDILEATGYSSRNCRIGGSRPMRISAGAGANTFNSVDDEFSQLQHVPTAGDVLIEAGGGLGGATTFIGSGTRLWNSTAFATAHTTGPANFTFQFQNENDVYVEPGLQKKAGSLAAMSSFGAFAPGRPESIAAAGTASGKNRWVIATGTGVVTLPASYPFSQALVFTVDPGAGGAITVTANAGQTILGGASVSFAVGTGRILMLDEANNWWVIGN